jgi:uncharacterized protein (DUF2336 family)
MTMTGQHSLLDELEDVLARQDIGRRADALRRITDLFVAASSRYSEEQIALFDDVMGRLVAEIDTSARAAFGRRLADNPEAPPNVMRTLALDDEIQVAEPVLLHSDRIDETTLVESAKTKSQSHLLAISRRQNLGEAVTDVLVQRGDSEVALSTARNTTAKFSEFGYATLVERSKDDDGLALSVWARPEIPRQHMLQLFERASEAVRSKLEAVDPRRAGMIRSLVVGASDKIQTEARNTIAGYAEKRAAIEALHAAGGLGPTQVAAYAREGHFDETAIALSVLGKLPTGLIERAIVSERPEQILILAKAIGLPWETVKEVLLLKGQSAGRSGHDIEKCAGTFERLQPATAKQALNFYRLRERAVASGGEQ